MPIECDFSEMSFAFAYTREALERWGPPGAAPTFPSTVAEGSLGYDVKFTQSQPMRYYFAQFKLSEQVVGWRGTLSRPLGVPYYHFRLRKPPSRQHLVLAALEHVSSFNVVEYVAPLFTSGHDLEAHAAARTIVDNSMRIRPCRISHHVPNPNDGDTHYVGSNGVDVWAASDPIRIDEPATPNLLDVGGPAETPSQEWADRVLDELESLVSQILEVPRDSVRQRRSADRSPFQEVADYCRAHLGGELIPLRSEQRS